MARINIIRQKSVAFAKRIVKLSQYLEKERREFILSKQILRSGTSIGANVAEASYGSSHRDFIAKLQIAEKEAAETMYWLELLESGNYLPCGIYASMGKDCQELLAILAAIIKSAKQNMKDSDT